METSRRGPTGETVDTSRHRALGSGSRVAILRMVRASADGLTADQVASGVGLHLTTVRAHLDRLAEVGLLAKQRERDGGPGRPSWRYRVAAAPPAPAPYRDLAGALLEDLVEAGTDVRAAALRVGRRWGQRLAFAGKPVDAVVAALEGLGFAPRRVGGGPDDDTAEVHLSACPFLELVAASPAAMCGLHLGVVRGVLERSGAAADEATLEPFGAPDACLLRIPARAAASRP